MIRAIIVLVISLVTAGPTFAWSGIGHKAIALIAEKHLTVKTREAVMKLLQSEQEDSLADVAGWADAMLDVKSPPQPVHGARLPVGADDYQRERDCPNDLCAIEAMKDFERVLADPEGRRAAKMQALKYAVHFVGDMHQPFHAISAKGWVWVDGKKTSLHKVWDNVIISSWGLDAITLAEIIDQSAPPPDNKGTPVDWILESHRLARDVILPSAEGFRQISPTVLPATYAAENRDLVARQMKAAGVRLAWTLNDIFDPEN